MNKVGSISSKRIFGCVVPNGMTYLTYVYCNSPDVIYLSNFNLCSLKYVGETVRNLLKDFTGTELILNNPLSMPNKPN